MTDLNVELNNLFEEWKTSLKEENGDDIFFTRDGLVYKNDQTIEETDHRWKNSEKRIMFILKDQPSVGADDDARMWLRSSVMDTEKNAKQKEYNRALKSVFLRNIARLFWGLYYSNKDWLCWFDEAKIEDLTKIVNEEPFAFVESKKIQGGTCITDKELTEHLRNYSHFLSREIDILNPNIVVCMGQPVFDSVLKIFEGKGIVTKKFKNIYVYDEGKSNVVILYAGHPSSPCSERELYDGAMEWYRYYIDPQYAKDCKII